MAKLIFNYSAMNSGKTMDLIRTAYNYEENGHKVLVMKPLVDTKGDDKIVTRIGLSRKVDVLIPKDSIILSLLKGKLDGVSCILIDEAQFLNEDQVMQLFIISNALDIPVICYGLRSNFKAELFEGSAKLLAVASELNEFKTLCHCGAIARYNARKVNGEYVTEGDKIVIDGTDNVEYVPLCCDCYTKEVMRMDYDKIKKFVKKM